MNPVNTIVRAFTSRTAEPDLEAGVAQPDETQRLVEAPRRSYGTVSTAANTPGQALARPGLSPSGTPSSGPTSFLLKGTKIAVTGGALVGAVVGAAPFVYLLAGEIVACLGASVVIKAAESLVLRPGLAATFATAALPVAGAVRLAGEPDLAGRLPRAAARGGLQAGSLVAEGAANVVGVVAVTALAATIIAGASSAGVGAAGGAYLALVAEGTLVIAAPKVAAGLVVLDAAQYGARKTLANRAPALSI